MYFFKVHRSYKLKCEAEMIQHNNEDVNYGTKCSSKENARSINNM